MAYEFKSTLTSPIDLGDVAYEVLVGVVIVPDSTAVRIKWNQYTAADVFVRRRSATIQVPANAVATTLGQIMQVARNQGVAQPGTDDYSELPEA